jgi:hypothetical protein
MLSYQRLCRRNLDFPGRIRAVIVEGGLLDIFRVGHAEFFPCDALRTASPLVFNDYSTGRLRDNFEAFVPQ